MTPSSAPRQDVKQARVGAVAAGADATEEVAAAPFAGTVNEVSYTPDGSVNGAADPNNRTLSLINQSNASVVVATLKLAAGVNLVQGVETQLTLSATPANLNVSNDDKLAFTSTHAGTGVADPGGLVEVGFTRGDVSA